MTNRLTIKGEGMNDAKRVGILGTGSYIPEKVVTNDDLAKILDTNDEWIRTRTGIRERHLAAKNENASDMAVAAADRAIEMSGIRKDQIGFIILATGTPDYLIPNTSSRVQDKLGLDHAGAVDISAGCAGFIHGLFMAKGLVAAGLFDYVFVISSEMLSRHLDWNDRNTCILFGDGAGAAIVGRGGRLYLHMKGKKVFEASVRHMRETAENVLQKEGITKDEVGLYLFHQANVRIIQCLAGKMEIPWEKIPIELDRLGNTGPASVAIALDLAMRGGRISKGSYVMMNGFGAGFIWSSLLLKAH